MSQKMNSGTLTIEQTLQQAVANHQSGRLQEAEELYRDILQAHPYHPEANHNRGVLAVQMQQTEASLPYFMAALNADPTCEQYWLSAIDALFQVGQLEAAQEVLTVAGQQGFQGNELNALAARLKDGVQTTEQPNADAFFKEEQPVSSFPQDDSKNPSPQEINTLAALFNEGRYTEAATLAQAMTERFPLHGFGWKVLGAAFKQMERNVDALEPMQKAAILSPDDADTHNNLGNTLKYLGRLDEAEACCRRALQIKPDFAETHSNLGNILMDLDRLDEAEASYRKALDLKPTYAKAHNNLGNTLRKLGRLDEAEVSYRRALQIKPDYIEALSNLGNTLNNLDRLDEAEKTYLRALEIKPDFIDAHYNLGDTLYEQGRLDQAEAHYRQALKIKPDFAEAHSNLGHTLKDLGRLDEAEASCRRAQEIKPDFADTHYNLARILQELGRLDEAESSYRRALEIKPDYVIAHSNLIFTLDLMDGKDSASLLEERKRWDATHAAHLRQPLAHTNIPDPERRMRIGYASADFKNHSASKAFGSMLTRYDRSQFEIVVYSNFKGKDDRFTELFKQNATVWRNIADLSDDAVAKIIREDRIDILIDLSGHTAGNRLLVFARKPAPIQITAWGYAASTGMRAMDVFFTDPVMVPPTDKRYFIEEIRYLPSVLGAFFIDPFPDITELPAVSSGIVTFGSFNRLAKVSEDSYRAWAKVLLAIPRSRLMLKTAELDDAPTRERITGHFTEAGITADRITLRGKTSWHEHMQAYHQIDIALDPFPQGGGVTALEGLMMGIPMINLQGPTMAGRGSASIMTTLGLPDWIAKNREDYVALAVRKAADLQSLATLRQQLRNMLNSSVIGDQTAYTQAVEQEYRRLWQEWCSRA